MSNDGVINKLILENAELKAKNKQLSNQLLGMVQELSRVQHENEDLETELRDILNKVRNTKGLVQELVKSEGVLSTSVQEEMKGEITIEDLPNWKLQTSSSMEPFSESLMRKFSQRCSINMSHERLSFALGAGLGSITLQCNRLNYRLLCPKIVIDYN